MMRIRQRGDDATLGHAPSHAGHPGPRAAQLAEEKLELRPEQMEGGLRGGSVLTDRSVTKKLKVRFSKVLFVLGLHFQFYT